MIRYFTYGSNMDKEDLDRWCQKRSKPEVKFPTPEPAILKNYKLSFNYYSSIRKSGAANIMAARGCCVYGLLMELEDVGLGTIRRKEGYPDYYNEICVSIEKFDGSIIRDVKTYKAVECRERLAHQPPSEYYLGLIVKNAITYNFPSDYIRFLESVKVKD